MTHKYGMNTFLRRSKSLLISISTKRPVSNFRRIILRALGYKLLEECEITDISSITIDILEESQSNIAAPNFRNEPPEIRKSMHPKIRAHIAHNVEISAYSSCLIREDKVSIPSNIIDQRHRIRTDTGNLFKFRQKYCIKKIGKNTSIESGILIGGAGAFNWYHFLVECLPKALLANHLSPEYDGFPFLVPDECRKIPSFERALQVFSSNREIKYFSRDQILRVEELINFDEVCIGPFNLFDGFWPVIQDYSQNDLFLKGYFAVLTENLLGSRESKAAQNKRIFLARPEGRRNYNQLELIEIAERYGFEAYAPGSLSLEQQAELFSSAAMVVGASGAAWVGMIFCPAPAKFVSWLPAEYSQFCCYSSMANLLGHEMHFIESTPDAPLESTSDAYGTGYHLDPVQFENSLKRLVGA